MARECSWRALSFCLVLDEDKPILTRDQADHGGIGVVESVEDYTSRTGNRPITEATTVAAEEIGAGGSMTSRFPARAAR